MTYPNHNLTGTYYNLVPQSEEQDHKYLKAGDIILLNGEGELKLDDNGNLKSGFSTYASSKFVKGVSKILKKPGEYSHVMLYLGYGYIHAVAPFVITNNVSKLFIKNKDNVKVFRIKNPDHQKMQIAINNVKNKIFNPYSPAIFFVDIENYETCTKLVGTFYEEVTGKKIKGIKASKLLPDDFLSLVNSNLVTEITDNNNRIYKKIDCISTLHIKDIEIPFNKISDEIYSEIKAYRYSKDILFKDDLSEEWLKKQMANRIALKQINYDQEYNDHFYSAEKLSEYIRYYEGVFIKIGKIDWISKYASKRIDHFINSFCSKVETFSTDYHTPKLQIDIFISKYDYIKNFIKEFPVMLEIILSDEEKKYFNNMLGELVIDENSLDNHIKVLYIFNSLVVIDKIDNLNDLDKNNAYTDLKQIEMRYVSALAIAKYLCEYCNQDIYNYTISEQYSMYLKQIVKHGQSLIDIKGIPLSFKVGLQKIISNIITSITHDICRNNITIILNKQD